MRVVLLDLRRYAFHMTAYGRISLANIQPLKHHFYALDVSCIIVMFCVKIWYACHLTRERSLCCRLILDRPLIVSLYAWSVRSFEYDPKPSLTTYDIVCLRCSRCIIGRSRTSAIEVTLCMPSASFKGVRR